jgi:ATP-dependent RNA helicase DHX57
LCAKTKTKIHRLGNQVGYQIRMESKRSKNTKLLFCTTGVILRRLQDDHELKSITHVIVDEVHERQVQTDVLLIALRQLLRTTRRDLKVILVRSLF